ncbi:MAG TPA: hypothetical protein V6C71_00640 [Coleofasciculaceae cyanobacterium]
MVQQPYPLWTSNSRNNLCFSYHKQSDWYITSSFLKYVRSPVPELRLHPNPTQ